MRRLALIAAVALAAASLTACGSRLSDQEVLAQAAGQDVATVSIPGSPTASGTKLPGVTAPTVGDGGGQAVAAPAPAATGKTAPTTVSQPATGQKPAAAKPAVAAVGMPVNIGSIGLWSGLVGQLLGGVKLGTQVSVAYLNAHGGLNGHPINLIIADDGGDPATGLSLAKKMIDEDHVIAFLNNLQATNGAAVIPYITGRGIPMIGGSGIESENWTSTGVFPAAANAKVQSMLAVKQGTDEGLKKIGIIYCTEFALLCKGTTAFVEANAPKIGGAVVLKQQVSLAQPDFTSQCLAAKGAGVDNFLLFMDPNSVVRLADACAAQNYHPRYSSVGIVLASTLTSTANTEGLVGPPGSFPFTYNGPETADFRRAFIEITGNPAVSNIQGTAWMGALILQKAGRQLPASPEPADLLAGLYRIKADDFGGLSPAPWTFAAGAPTNTLLCSFMTQIHNKAFVVMNGGLKPRCLTNFTPADFR